MAWRRPGDKPLSEPMMVSLLTHICVTRPQWVNSFLPKGIKVSVKWVITGLDKGFPYIGIHSLNQCQHDHKHPSKEIYLASRCFNSRKSSWSCQHAMMMPLSWSRQKRVKQRQVAAEKKLWSKMWKICSRSNTLCCEGQDQDQVPTKLRGCSQEGYDV